MWRELDWQIRKVNFSHLSREPPLAPASCPQRSQRQTPGFTQFINENNKAEGHNDTDDGDHKKNT